MTYAELCEAGSVPYGKCAHCDHMYRVIVHPEVVAVTIDPCPRHYPSERLPLLTHAQLEAIKVDDKGHMTHQAKCQMVFLGPQHNVPDAPQH